MEIIDKCEFAKVALDKNLETFVVYISTLDATIIYLSRTASITALQWAKPFTKIPAKYSKLLKNTGINKYAIKLIKRKQSPYGPIYVFNLVEQEILKVYIETYIKTWFIETSNSSVNALIFFDIKLDSSLFLVDYQGLNNFTFQNWYLFSLVNKALD